MRSCIHQTGIASRAWDIPTNRLLGAKGDACSAIAPLLLRYCYPAFQAVEDHAAGLISDENYVAFTNRYQSYQAENQGKIVVLDAKLAQQTDYQANAEQLRQAISDYLNIATLTPFILNKLIENIQVGHAETVNGQTVQEVAIVWRFAGVI